MSNGRFRLTVIAALAALLIGSASAGTTAASDRGGDGPADTAVPGVAETKTLKPGGGSVQRTVARRDCRDTRRTSWRNHVDVDAAPGLWAMNDAGWIHPLAAPQPNLISWFQVEASALADDRPLPVQPFLRCAQETTERAGAVRLTPVQILLPVQGIEVSARPPYALVPSMRTSDWFGELSPQARVPVKVRIDGGVDRSIPVVAPQLARHVVAAEQNVFAGEIDEALPQENFRRRRSKTASGTVRPCME
ncbi:hypothetical protein [Streptomyces sp. NPDC047976]|uniref:hypothetical protein n=1 Tax=Streptomyces sp. NPDC047976 TaxID=3155746 RepID=UPI0034372CAD